MEEKIIKEQTITEETILGMIQTVTKEAIKFIKLLIRFLKRHSAQETRKEKKKQQQPHEKFVLLVVILISQQKIVKREEETVHELRVFHLTRIQKTNNDTHVKQFRIL